MRWFALVGVAALGAACARHATPQLPATTALADADQDGIADAVDTCLDAKEDARGALGKDGCPEDVDGDAIFGSADRCQSEPETQNGYQDGDGCPDVPKADKPKGWRLGRVRLSESRIEIDEKVQFATASAVIEPVSFPLLDEVAATLNAHPDLDFVEIAGHADARGSDAQNVPLTKARAASVLDALVQRGVARARLRSEGYSSYCPLEAGSSDAAYAKNRRVEFRILRRRGRDLRERWGGCAGAEAQGMRAAPIPADAPSSKPNQPVASSAPAVVPAAAAPASADATTPLRGECAAGKALACLHLGVMLEGAAGVAPDLVAATDAFTKACEGGLWHACTKLGARLEHGGRAREAGVRYSAACNAGEGSACDRLGALHDRGVGVEPSPARAVELYRQACLGGDAPGCAGWGGLAYQGRGTERDRELGLGLLDKSCSQHWQPACGEAARLRADARAAGKPTAGGTARGGVAVEVDVGAKSTAEAEAPKARPEKPAPPPCRIGDRDNCKRACDLGHAESCTTLGIMVAYGIGGAKRDAEASLELFGKGAKGGHARAHVHLGLHFEGRGADAKKARASYQSACDGGDLAGCNHLGRLELGAKNHARARALFERACDGGEGAGCHALGQLYEKGTAVGRDADKALDVYQRGCRAGSVPSCSARGVLQVKTSKSAATRADGLAKVRWACDQHYARACADLKVLSRCEYGDIGDCRARCESKDTAMCGALGDYYAEGRWVAQSDVEARLWYRAAYEGSLDRCH
jgi:TPR repeat protein/outer membrane protein OmpA-like peptidoglycan-associated protein